jgi:hypothetical protein
MAVQGTIHVTDRDGWQHAFALDKALLYIGSAPGNDIVLPVDRGTGVAARQLQLVALGEDDPRYRVVNLGPGDVRLTAGEAALETALAARAVGILADGDGLQLGDFSLTFRLGEAAHLPGQGRSSARQRRAAPATAGTGEIGLTFHLDRSEIEPDREIEGMIAVQNAGDKPGVQFRIDLLGLPASCYEMGPGPILFPGAEKLVPLRICHPRGPDPAAGEYRIVVRVSAPDAYPGQRAEATATIRVAPFYQHLLRFVPQTG